jgi:hypothetical protein
MKKYIILLLIITPAISRGQILEGGIRTGINTVYHEHPFVYYPSRTSLQMELFFRKEKKKGAIDITIGQSATNGHNSHYTTPFYGTATYIVEDVNTRIITMTVSWQRKILTHLSKKDRLKNYIGPTCGLLYSHEKHNNTIVYLNNENLPTSDAWQTSHLNPTVGISYNISYCLTKTVMLETNIRPILSLDNYQGTYYSNTRIFTMIGIASRL